MLTTDALVSHLKDFRLTLKAGVMRSGLTHTGNPTTDEQKAWLVLSHQLSVARLYLQLMTDDMWEEMVELEENRETPVPW